MYYDISQAETTQSLILMKIVLLKTVLQLIRFIHSIKAISLKHFTKIHPTVFPEPGDGTLIGLITGVFLQKSAVVPIGWALPAVIEE